MDELLSRGVDQIIGREELEEALGSKKRKLRIKFGVDPTRPDIHLGHAIPLRQLRQFQDLGHTVIFLIGDYTTKIGDPSGKDKTRPILGDEEITANAKTYLDQVGKILNVNKAEIRYNSEWLAKLSFADLLGLASNVSVAQFIERDDFKNRLESGRELALHELLYPLMQAYDSVALEADVEFGGTDQLFNLLTARAFQKKLGQRPQIVFTSELLVGLDGTKKMSKSLDNYIGITDEPTDMYGKIMSLPDALIAPYYKLCTDMPLATIDELVKTLSLGANPRDSKASLAREIVRTYHGEAAALKAEESWNQQFRDGGRPADIPKVTIDLKSGDAQDLFDVLVSAGLAETKSEVRRVMQQGGIRLNGEIIDHAELAQISSGDVVQVGKRRYLEFVVKK
ncbi:MAG TPA: tyrosine--tRNA ligase [Candidatus Saccharimonadia bacterium]|nr:tyrosine--tRNA ligase [Candidatus Saccharimonadia bacterium]